MKKSDVEVSTGLLLGGFSLMLVVALIGVALSVIFRMVPG